MRFPLSLTRSLAGYLLRQKLSGATRFPMVLMLEPLHACNLHCSGCGRIREYAETVHQSMTLAECVEAVDHCDAPVVSICGGEPLIYPPIEALVDEIVRRRKHVYLCTNGLALAKRLRGLQPTSRLFLNVHLDGMEATHDRIVQRKGVFSEAIAGIRKAKQAGFQVCTNTTIYRQTDIHEVAVLFEYLSQLGVDGFLISPAFGYEAVRESSHEGSDQIFMSRQETHAKFSRARELLADFRLMSTPIYMEMLAGQRNLSCAAWANPTRNVKGWKGPCYLITDSHYTTYQQLLNSTTWDELGPGKDPRCEHCLVHCGFEPAAVLAARGNLRDMLQMAVWQMT
jgi:hopanoid biosynthesis associated radical SAM protein HpnH